MLMEDARPGSARAARGRHLLGDTRPDLGTRSDGKVRDGQPWPPRGMHLLPAAWRVCLISDHVDLRHLICGGMSQQVFVLRREGRQLEKELEAQVTLDPLPACCERLAGQGKDDHACRNLQDECRAAGQGVSIRLGTALGSPLKQIELGVVTAPGRGEACIFSSGGPLGSKGFPTTCSLRALQ